MVYVCIQPPWQSASSEVFDNSTEKASISVPLSYFQSYKEFCLTIPPPTVHIQSCPASSAPVLADWPWPRGSNKRAFPSASSSAMPVLLFAAKVRLSHHQPSSHDLQSTQVTASASQPMPHNHCNAFSRLASGPPSKRHVLNSETTDINSMPSPARRLDGRLGLPRQPPVSQRPTMPIARSFGISCYPA